jgi:hypothetical protein
MWVAKPTSGSDGDIRKLDIRRVFSRQIRIGLLH